MYYILFAAVLVFITRILFWSEKPNVQALAGEADGVVNEKHLAIYKAGSETTLNELRAKFGSKKIIPAKLEHEVLTALSLFPELTDVNIQFKYDKSKYALTSRPAIPSLLNPAAERKYFVIISNNLVESKMRLNFNNVSREARIGVIGHELCHIVDYERKSVHDLISIGLKYGKLEYRKNYEAEIDAETIRRGLGRELAEWNKIIHEIPDSNNSHEVYMTPEAICNFMLKLETVETSAPTGK